MNDLRDTRDLRDPEELGFTLLDQAAFVRRAYGETIPLSEIYDFHVRFFDINDYESEF